MTKDLKYIILNKINILRERSLYMEYYYEEDYPDCLGEDASYLKQPACLTCLWKKDCENQIKADDDSTIWEREYLGYLP